MSLLGLEIARRALIAHRQALDVSAHNIANARTPGYSRQRVNLVTTTPIPGSTGRDVAGVGQFGTGMEVASVTRLRDLFLDRQYRDRAASLGYWQTKDQVLAEIEQILAEPANSSLRTALDDLWQAWQQLANNPESLAARETVLQRAATVVDLFREADRYLRQELRPNLNSSVEQKVQRVNELAAELARVNERIVYARGAGQEPNDLLDQRDRLLDELARLLPVDTVEEATGAVRVLAGGAALVDGIRSYRLAVQADPANDNYWRVVWEGTALAADLGGGELGALVELRDRVVPDLHRRLEDLAWALATATNARHAAGYDLSGAAVAGQPWEQVFTVPVLRGDFRLATLAVNPALASSPERLAAAANPNSPGDGTNALAIAGLRRQPLADLGNATMDDFYRAFIADLGSQADGARRMGQVQQALTDKIDQQRQSVGGVNLDEELAQLIQYQYAFQAAARLVNTVDEILDTVINRLGLIR